jgi:hypothetical protein
MEPAKDDDSSKVAGIRPLRGVSWSQSSPKTFTHGKYHIEKLMYVLLTGKQDRINDLSSGKSHTDEGYHSISGGSHSDGRSVFSSDTSQRFTARIPLMDLLGSQPVDFDLPGPVVDYATQPQQKPNSFECREEGCDYESGTQSDLKCVTLGLIGKQ